MAVMLAPRFTITNTPVLSTSALSANEVWFPTTALQHSFFSQYGGNFKLEQIVIQDKDYQTAAAITFWFFNADVALGTANNTVSMTDTLGENIVGTCVVASASFVDGVQFRLATATPNIIVSPSSAGILYYAATNAGTPTNTASGVVIRLSFSAAS